MPTTEKPLQVLVNTILIFATLISTPTGSGSHPVEERHTPRLFEKVTEESLTSPKGLFTFNFSQKRRGPDYGVAALLEADPSPASSTTFLIDTH